jgi:predicted HicB family RNase H-like nuclease
MLLGDAVMSKTETLNLRVSADFKKRLMQEAAKERRSVTNYLETTLLGYWARRDSMVVEAKEKQK